MSAAFHASLGGSVGVDGEVPRQAKTRRGKRALQEREPQEHEDVKRLLLLRGLRASARVQEILGDLRDMKKPYVVFLRSIRRRGGEDGHQKKHVSFHPFEDVSSGEFLCEKNNCGFFCLGSTSKKRPARLVFARMFAHQLLDMYELEVSRYIPASAFRRKEKPHVGSTPIVLLQGAQFETDEVLRGLRNLFADLFKGTAHISASPTTSTGATPVSGKHQRLYLAGIDRVIAISAIEPCAGSDVMRSHVSEEPFAAEEEEDEVGQVIGKPKRAKEGAAEGDPLFTTKGTSLMKENSQQSNKGDGKKALICLRQYRLVLKKGLLGETSSSVGGPRVELEEVGPQIDMQLDRCRLADADRWKRATACRAAATAAERKQHEAATAEAMKSSSARRGVAAATAAAAQVNRKKRKTTTTALGDVVGKVYVEKPDWRALNAQKNVLLIKHNRKRTKLTADAAAAAETVPAQGPRTTKKEDVSEGRSRPKKKY